MIVLGLILVLNEVNIFVVDRLVVQTCVSSCFIVYCLTMLIVAFSDLSKVGMKYFILLCEIIMITIVTTFLTYHALLAYAIPIISSSMYSSKRVTCYTYTLLAVSTCISVFGGYHLGICDANMVLLTSEPLSNYLTATNEFHHTKVNDDIFYTLSLFYVVPRCLILLALTIMCSSISKTLNLNMDYARKMENVAGTDGMTGLYNRTKYMEMKDVYTQLEKVGAIFWDVNFLKKINDTMGHEFGDKLILTVAESIAMNTNKKDMAYRIGGDEFIMVIPDADEEILAKKIDSWRNVLDRLQTEVDFDISVAVGYAYGDGKDFETIIAKADKMMYDNKTKNIASDR